MYFAPHKTSGWLQTVAIGLWPKTLPGVRLFHFERAALGPGGYRKSDKGRANEAETEDATVVLPEPIVKGKDLVYQLLSMAGTVVYKKGSDPYLTLGLSLLT